VRILIAEDDATSRRILEAVLKKWGHDVISTTDGAEAWSVLSSPGSPRLAILDWMMPELDGVEVCRRLRQDAPDGGTYVILLTAKSEKRDIVEGLDSGADDFVAKPFDRDELRARVAVGSRVIELQTALAERIEELEAAMEHIQTLQGILPICMHCRKIRNDGNAWQEIEEYVEHHSEAHFSHGVCPQCLEEHYADDD
jgi:DNA-binding response OmpR family regulator